MNKHNELTPKPINREHFQVQGTTLVAFASDIASLDECVKRGYPWMKPIYNDAADVGLAIPKRWVAPGEPESVRFYLSQEDATTDDFQAWHFKPCKPAEAGGITEVVIFND